MLVFFDCEFTGLHRNTTLISIGLVAESGSQFYAEFTDYDATQINSWVAENVLSHLGQDEVPPPYVDYIIGRKIDVELALRNWFIALVAPSITMVGDVLAYDWMLFCDLMGGPFEIPSNISYIPLDLATLLYAQGHNPDVNREEFSGVAAGNKHNALWDAQIIRDCHNRLALERERGSKWR